MLSSDSLQAIENKSVLHVITDLDVGGAERMLVNYLTSSANIAERSVVFSLKSPGAMAIPLREAGIPVLSGDIADPAAGLMGALVTVPRAGWRLSKVIARQKPLSVVGWMYHANVFAYEALRWSGRRNETRFVAGIRCSAMQGDRYGWSHRIIVSRSRQISGSVDVLAYNSNAGRREHEAIGFSPNVATVVSNGVDTDRFRPDPAARARIRAELGISEDRAVLLQAARVDPMKDYASLLQAFRLQNGTADLVIVGKGTDSLPPMPGLHRLGVRTDMPDIYAAADVIVMSSAFGEGFPNVVGEGMACGLVPVVTDVGDASLIAGESGHCVPSSDPDALAQALSDVINGLSAKRGEWSTLARRHIEGTFSLAASVNRLDGIIEKSD